MPTFIKPGFWEKKQKGYDHWLNLDQLIQSLVPPAGVTSITAGAGISVNQTTGNVTISALAQASTFEYNSNETGIQPALGTNDASGDYATIGGGKNNISSGSYSTIGGGQANTAQSTYSIIGGGCCNVAGKSNKYLEVKTGCLFNAYIYSPNSNYIGGYVNYISPDRSVWCFSGDKTSNFYGADSISYLRLNYSSINLCNTPYCINSASYIYPNTCVNLSPTLPEKLLEKTYTNNGIFSGKENKIYSENSFIGGGVYNKIYSECSAILGGVCNTVPTNYYRSFIIGNQITADTSNATFVNNLVIDSFRTQYGKQLCVGSNGIVSLVNSQIFERGTGFSSILGIGYCNVASGNFSFVAGCCNVASGNSSTVVGGRNNIASGVFSSVASGQFNTASGVSSFIGGGGLNCSQCCSSFIGSGSSNVVSGGCGFIGSGRCNLVSLSNSSIITGYSNTVSNCYSFIGSGRANTVSGHASIIGGGRFNTASGYTSFVGGGQFNTASGNYSTIAGGCCNITNSRHSVISGGQRNIIQSPTNECCSKGVTIGGGIGHNSSGGTVSAVTGNLYGIINCCNSGAFSTIAGGLRNCAISDRSAILGGQCNSTSTFTDVMIVGSCLTADRVCTTFVNNLSIKNIPTSSAGLPSGAVWSNSCVLTIV